jgi:hypothetical protein
LQEIGGEKREHGKSRGLDFSMEKKKKIIYGQHDHLYTTE